MGCMSVHSVATAAVPKDLPAPVDDGLRERKKRATRRALRAAALRLVAEHGLDAVTTDQVAAAADVSPRTFFNYFTSKEDALVGNDPDLPGALVRELAERPAGEEVLDSLRAVFVSYAETVSIDQEMWRLRKQVIDANPGLVGALLGASAELERTLTVAVAERIGADPLVDLYPALVVNVATAAARTALQHCGADALGRRFADALSEAFDALATGLPAPTPR